MRIAVLGGTFDPIHNGHLGVARTVAATFEIDEVHFIPAYTPPHKPGSEITSAFHRVAMLALATEPFERFRLSTIEVDRLEARYTVDTLELMHELYSSPTLLFITGTDLYREIEEWKDYRRLFELASLAVVERPGFPMREDLGPVEVVRDGPVRLSPTPRVYYLPGLNLDISSTRLREAIRAGSDTGRWIPGVVQTYIARHRLYV